MKHVVRLVILWALFASMAHAQKPKITSQDQLPRFNYPLTGKVTDVLTNDAAYEKLAAAVRANLEQLLSDYDIADRTTLQDIQGALLALDVQAGRYDSALSRVAVIRNLDEKPAAKLTAGLLVESYILARRSGEFANEAAFRAAFEKTYAQKLAALPWNVVGDVIKQTKGNAEI